MVRYSVITASVPKRLYTKEEAGIYLGYPALLDRLVQAGWLKPLPKSGKFELYDCEDMDACITRLKAGDKLE
jgi:hypothetical protein